MLGIYHEAQRGSPGVICVVEEEHGEEYGKEDQGTPFRQWRSIQTILSYNYVVMRTYKDTLE